MYSNTDILIQSVMPVMKLNYPVFYLVVTVILRSGEISRVDGVGDRVSMTSTIPLQGIQCGGPVRITCRANRLAGVFWWINASPNPIARFTEITEDLNLPVNFTDSKALNLGWVVLLTGLSGPLNSQYNFTTTIDTTTSQLMQQPLSSIWCGRNLFNASLNVSLTIRDVPATPSEVPCSLSPSPATSLVSMTLYLVDFIRQNAIDRYTLGVTSSSQLIPGCSGDYSDEIYTCHGLQVGTDYALSLQGFNCGSQGGGIDRFRIYAQVPSTPTIKFIHNLYDKASRLIQLTVIWTQQFTPPVSSRCLYFDSVRYEVLVLSLTGQEQYTATATPDACNDGVCSILVNISTTGVSQYNVSVQARNDFGSSGIAYYHSAIASKSSRLLNHSFSFSNCITYALCTSPLRVTNCTVTYSTDSSYPDNNPQTTGPLNSSFQLPLLRRLTTYYHEANISVTSSFSVVVRGEFRTGDFAIRLTSQNIILIVIGSVLLTLSLAPLIINIILVITVKPLLGKIIIGIILASEVIILIPAIILWIVTGQIISSQANTCDEHWQSQRDSLIIAAHVLSDLALLVSAPALFASLVIKFSIKEVKKPKEEPVYHSQYDYIDKNKAEERGIYMRQNYAYSNPFKKKKKATVNLDKAVGAFYEDANINAGVNQHDIKLKANYAYHPTANTKKELDKLSKSKKSKKDIYAPPMKMRGDQNIGESLGNCSSTSDDCKTSDNESMSISKGKPQIHPRKIYAPPVLASSKDKRKCDSNTSDEGPKHEYSYVASTRCDPIKSTDKSNKPVPPHSKDAKGIKLKENCAYTESNVRDTESGQVYADGYVGPVVPPIQHTEGIALKSNYAYKVGGLKGKIRAKKDSKS